MIIKWICVYILTILLIWLVWLFSTIPVQSSVISDFRPLSEHLVREMEYLRQCESGGNDLSIHKADGNSDSLGRFQWKIESIYFYNQRFKILPNIEKMEIANVIYDPEIQDEFTYRVLAMGDWKNWYNCLKNYDRP